MRRVRVIPVLLLLNNGLVKTKKFKKPVYIGDPINAVKIFNEKEVDEIVLLDISATKEKRNPDFTKIQEIGSEAFMPFSYGGGIKNLDEIKTILNAGAEKVILNTEAYNNPKLITEAANLYGNQSVVVSIDVRKSAFGKYNVFINSGKKKIKTKLIDYLKQMENAGAGEVFITNIGHEGTFAGYDLELIQLVSENLNIPVIANGGARNIDDFHKAISIGASAVAAGSRFVYSTNTNGILINYPDQIELIKNFYQKLD
ncbi:MAG: imidazole glycerol phosphate synthase subunit HisF [Chlorobi bacterium]|nr:imidazole glycerol phosphate synthase subunit HisF [Chlorobiota bacterium]